jgi:uncharacterized DUF497 family protein
MERAMAIEFAWDRDNLREVTPHGVYAAHAEDAIQSERPLALRPAFHNGEWRLSIVGLDSMGRILVVVFTPRGNRIRVVTAYPARPRLQRQYRRTR